MNTSRFSKDGPPVFADQQSLTTTFSYPLVAQEDDKARLTALLREGTDVLITERKSCRGERLAWQLSQYYPGQVNGNVQVVRVDSISLRSTRELLAGTIESSSSSSVATRGMPIEEIEKWLFRELTAFEADQIVIVYHGVRPEILAGTPSPQAIFQDASKHLDATVSIVAVPFGWRTLPSESEIPKLYHFELGPYSPTQLSRMVEHRINSAFLANKLTEGAIRCSKRLVRMYDNPFPILGLLCDLGSDIEWNGGCLPITATEVASAFREKRYNKLESFALTQSDHARLLLRAIGELAIEGQTPVPTRMLRDRYESICEDIGVSVEDKSTLQRKLRELRTGPSPYGGLLWSEQHNRQGERGGKYNTYRLAGDIDLELIDFVVEYPFSQEDRQSFRQAFYYAGLSGTAQDREELDRQYNLDRRPECERQWSPPSNTAVGS